jgi:hypothetical protein
MTERAFAAAVKEFGDDYEGIAELALSVQSVSPRFVESHAALAVIFKARTLEVALEFPGSRMCCGVEDTKYPSPPPFDVALRDLLWCPYNRDRHMAIYKSYIKPTLADAAQADRFVFIASVRKLFEEDGFSWEILAGIGHLSIAELVYILSSFRAFERPDQLDVGRLADCTGLPRVFVFGVCVWKVIQDAHFRLGRAETNALIRQETTDDLQRICVAVDVSVSELQDCMACLNTYHLLGNDNPLSRGIGAACALGNVFDCSKYNTERYLHNPDDMAPAPVDGRIELARCNVGFPDCSSGACVATVILGLLKPRDITPDATNQPLRGFSRYSSVPYPSLVPGVFSRAAKTRALASRRRRCSREWTENHCRLVSEYARTIPRGYQTIPDCLNSHDDTMTPKEIAIKHMMTKPVILRVAWFIEVGAAKYGIPLEIATLIAEFMQRSSPFPPPKTQHPPIGLPPPRPTTDDDDDKFRIDF